MSCANAALAANSAGLVGFWRFDEGSGVVARDFSGENHHGEITGATFVKRGEGHALCFDEETDLVEVPADPSLDIGSAGTISLWFKPEELRGGLFSWGARGEGARTHLALGFDSRPFWGDPRNDLCLYAGEGGGHRHYQPLNDPTMGEWNHLALVISGRRVMSYRDGAPDMEISLALDIDVKDRPFVIGRFVLGEDAPSVLKGLIDEVRVYNRPLSAEEILADYRQDAALLGKDDTLFRRPRLEVEILPDPGRIIARVHCALMSPVPQGAMVLVALSRTAGEEALVSRERPVDGDGREMVIALDAAKLPPGKYLVRAVVRKPNGGEFGDPSTASVDWPGQTEVFKNVKILNNLVWELINEGPGVVDGVKEYTFVQPKRRWVYVACTAGTANQKLTVSIDDSVETRDIIVFDRGTETRQEAMRFLPAGEHKLTLRSEGAAHIADLVVRSVPEIVYQGLMVKPRIARIAPYGPYDDAFMKRYVVPNVNVFVLSANTKPSRWEEPLFKELQARGNHRWLSASLAPHIAPPHKFTDKGADMITAQEAYDYIVQNPGMTRPELHGIMADEFGSSVRHCAIYPEVLRKIHANPEFADRMFYPYAGSLWSGPAGRELVKALMDTGSAFALKRYLQVRHTERAAYDFACRSIIGDLRKYREFCPGAVEHLTFCFGFFTAPPFGLNVVPQTNRRIFLDMQFNLVANAPEAWGAYGLMSYGTRYADEETIRWTTRLFRHYGIEGATESASSDPYDSSCHLADGDFAEDTGHWTLSAAEPNSIRRVQEQYYSFLQGRYKTTRQGDTALLMVRSAKGPNSFSQAIRNLEPGRMYTFRMITGDYQDLTKEEEHSVRIKLDDVEVTPERSFSHAFPNVRYYGPYDRNNHAWMNYHWILFRAKSATAKLTVSDWQSEEDPGGPIGQQLMCNFLQVHPYFERSE